MTDLPLREKLEQQKAKRYVKENWSLIVLHALYQRWGLPTAKLSALLSEDTK